VDEVDSVLSESPNAAGSEDATYMIDRVKKNGGLASYVIFGTTLAAGHHNEKFDIKEDSMIIAVKCLSKFILQIDRLKKDEVIG
jgi:aminobenzoyl-glutamate utilization protein A